MDEMPGMIRPDLQALPQVKDRMIVLYLHPWPTGRRDHGHGRKRGGLHPGGGHLGAAAGAGHACLYGITPAYAGGDSGPSVRPPRKESFSPHMRG